jgi:hypothetical protein
VSDYLFSSESDASGEYAAVLEADEDVTYFYLYRTSNAEGQRIAGAIEVCRCALTLRPEKVEIRWINDERVALFLNGILWAGFDLRTGAKYGGNYSPGAPSQVPAHFWPN